MKLFTIAQIINDHHLPGGGGSNATPDTLKKALTIIFTTIGALAVLLVIVAGVRYMTAAGDPEKVKRAKNAIGYALIGLVIAASADIIVNFVIRQL